MTTMNYPDVFKVLAVRDGMATAEKEMAEFQARGAGELSEDAMEQLKNDPAMEDAALMTFGGWGGKQIVQKPAWEIMTRREKQELKKAKKLHERGQYAELVAKYNTYRLGTIIQLIQQRMIDTPRSQGIRFTRNGMVKTALSARRGCGQA